MQKDNLPCRSWIYLLDLFDDRIDPGLVSRSNINGTISLIQEFNKLKTDSREITSDDEDLSKRRQNEHVAKISVVFSHNSYPQSTTHFALEVRQLLFCELGSRWKGLNEEVAHDAGF